MHGCTISAITWNPPNQPNDVCLTSFFVANYTFGNLMKMCFFIYLLILSFIPYFTGH